MSYGTVPVVVTTLATLPERRFPESRHRSRRVLKKLLKRHGGLWRRAPAVLRIDGVMYVHPEIAAMWKEMAR